ncbi:hypothetical protein RUND412_011250 [Rhizina undulata]
MRSPQPLGSSGQVFIQQDHPIPLDAIPPRDANGQFVAHPPPQMPVQHEHNAVPIVDIHYAVFQGPHAWVIPQAPALNTAQHGIHYQPVCVQSVAMEQTAMYYNGCPNPGYYRQRVLYQLMQALK